MEEAEHQKFYQNYGIIHTTPIYIFIFPFFPFFLITNIEKLKRNSIIYLKAKTEMYGMGGRGGEEGGRPRDSAPITAIYHRRASDWLPRRPMASEGNFAEKMDPPKGLGNFCLPLDNCLCLLATEVWIYRASGTCGYYSVDTLVEDPSGLERIIFLSLR